MKKSIYKLNALLKHTAEKKSPINIKKKKMKKLLNEMWHIVVFKKYGDKCIACGAPAVDAHHVVRRSQSLALKYDYRNGVPLCKGCHRFKYHLGDVEVARRILEFVGDRYDYLLEHKHDIVHENIGYLLECGDKLVEAYDEG